MDDEGDDDVTADSGTQANARDAQGRWARLVGRRLHPQDYSGQGSYRPPARWYRRLNHVGVPLTTLGLAPRDAVTLEVRGRRTGRPRRLPILVTRHEGSDYLVALAGESQWVRNVRAAGGEAVLRRRGTRRVRLDELPVDRRPPVLAAYLEAGRRRSGEPAAREQAKWYFGLEEPPTQERLAELAPRYPVFRVTDIEPAAAPDVPTSRKRTVHIAGEVVIAAAVTEVFDIVADERNEPRYNPRIVRAEKVTDGPVGAGSRFVAEPKGMGAKGEMTLEIVEYQRPHRLRNVIGSSYLHVEGILTFAETDGGTRLRWDWDMRLVGPMRVLTPVLVLVGPRWERRNWVGLKEYLEAGRR